MEERDWGYDASNREFKFRSSGKAFLSKLPMSLKSERGVDQGRLFQVKEGV